MGNMNLMVESNARNGKMKCFTSNLSFYRATDIPELKPWIVKENGLVSFSFLFTFLLLKIASCLENKNRKKKATYSECKNRKFVLQPLKPLNEH